MRSRGAPFNPLLYFGYKLGPKRLMASRRTASTDPERRTGDCGDWLEVIRLSVRRLSIDDNRTLLDRSIYAGPFFEVISSCHMGGFQSPDWLQSV
jgi:hypothetical protein